MQRCLSGEKSDEARAAMMVFDEQAAVSCGDAGAAHWKRQGFLDALPLAGFSVVAESSSDDWA